MNRKGFTLIELLVVVAVLALLASIVFSNLGGAREGARISNALSFQSQTHSLLGSDLVGWWKLDEGFGSTGKDISGYDNNTSINESYASWVQGLNGMGIKTDGQEERLKVWVPTSQYGDNSYNSGPMTISTWINFDVLSGNYILCRYVWRFIRTGSEISFNTGRMDQADGSQISPSDGTGFSVTSSGANIQSDRWYHLTAIYYPDYPGGNGYISLYINGDYHGQRSIGAHQMGTNYGSTIGIRWGTTAHGSWSPTETIFNDTRIYSRAFTAKDIDNLYYAGLKVLLVNDLMDDKEYQERISR